MSSDGVANFPDVPEVQQQLPPATESTSSSSFVVPIVPLSPSSHSSTGSNNFNLQVSPVGGDGYFSVRGNTRPFSSNFRALGGNWYKDLGCWKFEGSYLSEVTKFVSCVNDGTIKPEKIVTNNYKNKKRENYQSFQSTQNNQSAQSPTPFNMGSVTSNSDFPTLPTINGSQNQGHGDSDYQTVIYTGIFRPKVGMEASLKVKNQTKLFRVVKVKSSGQFVDSAEIDIGNGNISELVIAKGKWMVWGLNDQHTVFFKK